MLTKDQLNTIKSFPESVLQSLRKALQCSLNKKEDYNWIVEFGITECRKQNMSIPSMLRKHGFEHSATRLDGRPYHREETHYSHEQATSEINRITEDENSFNNMVKLFGKEHAISYQQRIIQNIINHVLD